MFHEPQLYRSVELAIQCTYRRRAMQSSCPCRDFVDLFASFAHVLCLTSSPGHLHLDVRNPASPSMRCYKLLQLLLYGDSHRP